MDLQQREGFQDLDLKVQTIIRSLAQSPQSFEELKTLIQAENMTIKEHISTTLGQQRSDLAHKEYRQQFLQSLWYPEIYSRQERVREAHQKTFQWVFERHDFDESTPRWTNFVDWLEQRGGLYWISGKAGSGKSTLMNFIYQDNRTRHFLATWSGAKLILTPGVFLWNAGTALEKSTEGLLRSLLYQILKKLPNLTSLSTESHSSSIFETDDPDKCAPIAAWTERRLRSTFQNVIRQAQAVCRFCIFIDGLDEISGDSDAVIEVIKNMLSADVKVCVSSRPDQSYTDTFGSGPMLKLQDLTEPDIKAYMLDKLHPWLQKEPANLLSRIMIDIAQKAQGVFLWVELVVKTLIRGLENCDSVEQLQRRVQSTPSDINGLYAKMLSNIDDVYHEDTARLLQMALADLTRSFLDVVLALYNKFDRVSEISIQEALKLSDLTQKKMQTICAGLLEVHQEDKDSRESGGKFSFHDCYLSLPIRYTDSPESADLSFYEKYVHVGFIHRTAVEFFRGNKQGQQFLEANTMSSFSAHSCYVRALLTKVKLLRFPTKSVDIEESFRDVPERILNEVPDRSDPFLDRVARNFVSQIMRNISVHETATGAADVSLCDDVDRTLATIHQRQQDVPPSSHWSTEWNVSPIRKSTSVLLRFQTGSGSSSPAPFHPSRIESRPNLDTPVDFLGHAASWALSSYVLQIVDLQQKNLDKGYMNYLLCCSMRAINRQPSCLEPLHNDELIKPVNLIAELSSRGADPNIYLEAFYHTVWGLLLRRAVYTRLPFLRTALATTIKIFLEHGADVHWKFLNQIHTRCMPVQGQTKAKHEWEIDMYFRHEMSVLYFLRRWFEREPELRALEEIIEAKGGRDSHRYTHFALKRDGYRPHKISRRRHEKLIATLNTTQHGYKKALDMLLSVKDRCEWEDQVRKAYREIVESNGDSDCEMYSDEESATGSDTEEEFYDAVDTQAVSDEQDYQSTN